MEASEERRRIVAGVFSLDRIGVSMSSAELSKNERTVSSAVRKTTNTISTRPLQRIINGGIWEAEEPAHELVSW